MTILSLDIIQHELLPFIDKSTYYNLCLVNRQFNSSCKTELSSGRLKYSGIINDTRLIYMLIHNFPEHLKYVDFSLEINEQNYKKFTKYLDRMTFLSELKINKMCIYAQRIVLAKMKNLMEKNNQLKNLHLINFNNHIFVENISLQLNNLSNLKSLYLNDCYKVDVLGLEKLTNLEILHTNRNITDADLRNLFKLEELVINEYSEITDSGISRLVNLKKLVTNNRISDFGICNLINLETLVMKGYITKFGLMDLKKLKTLYITNYRITEEYIKELELENLPKLETIRINSIHNITPEYLQELKNKYIILYN